MRVLKKVNWVTASFLVLTPLIAVIWGGAHIARFGVYPFDVLLFLLYIAATGFSITAGYHRHFAHAAAMQEVEQMCQQRNAADRQRELGTCIAKR